MPIKKCEITCLIITSFFSNKRSEKKEYGVPDNHLGQNMIQYDLI